MTFIILRVLNSLFQGYANLKCYIRFIGISFGLKHFLFPYIYIYITIDITFSFLDVGPRFVKNPEPIVAPLGDEVEFDCSLDVRADHLRWKHNGRILPYVFNDTAKSQMIFKVTY